MQTTVRILRHMSFVAATVVALPGLAETARQCETVPITVQTTAGVETDVAETVCDAARNALPVLGACGLTLKAPVTIIVVEGSADPHNSCFGQYDCKSGQIRVASPASLKRLRADDGPYAVISAKSHFLSLIGHELAHAAVHHMSGRQVTVADTEYVAYAMQMTLLGPEGRARFLSRKPIVPPVETSWINDFILALDPVRFAALVWAHFDGPDGGCGFVSDLVTGRITLEQRPF